MKCPHCSETIDDHSAFCPFCGQGTSQKFCAKCGGSMVSHGSKWRTFIAMLIVMMIFGLVILQVTRGGNERSVATEVARKEPEVAARTYSIVSSEETTFASHVLRVVVVRVSPYAGHAGVVTAARDIAQQEMTADRGRIVDMRIFTGDQFKEDTNAWDARAIAVDFGENPTYVLPGDGFEQTGEYLYVQWRAGE